MPGTEWTNINVGQLTPTQLANLVRETRAAIGRVDNIWPQGERKQRAQIKATKDRFGNYHIYLNNMALLAMLLYFKDVANPLLKQDLGVCPPEVPDFMRWGDCL